MTAAPASSRSQDKIVSRFREYRLVPVIVIDNPGSAPSLARALVNGGLPCAEITFRTKGARESIERISAECPELLVGAGTILTVQQAIEARNAGARFIVSPGFGPDVVDYCLEHGIPVFPGIATPTEIQAALSRGLKVLKFFPAQPLGGVQYLKAISAPFGAVEFMPTGGIGLMNLGEYLRFPRVVACGGSWMATSERIAAKDFAGIENDVREAVEVVRALESDAA